MSVSFSRSAIIGLLLGLLTLLAGCNALRLGYGQAPTLAYWWLDGYADFNDEHKPRIRQSIADWFLWHRAHQLNDYAAMLVRAQGEVPSAVTAEQICRWHGEILQRLALAADRAVPALAQAAVSLTPDQLVTLEKKYAKGNQKYAEEFMETSPPRRLKASVKRAVGHAEMLYGDLTDAQIEVLAQGVAASPFKAEVSLGERKARQHETLAVLQQVVSERPAAAQVEARMRMLVAQVQHSPRPAYRAYQERLTQHHCVLAARLHNTTTPAQRLRAVERLKGWEADFRALAAAASAP
jgi:uncharacterized coiled-coil protein SlyX